MYHIFKSSFQAKLQIKLPVDTPPTFVNNLTSLETPQNRGNYYGSRIRGYVCPPLTGEYTFYLSSDDQSEMWLSNNDDPATKTKIAFINSYTRPYQFNKYKSQVSEKIVLNAGDPYYFEILHKENDAYDHLAVYWKVPGNSSPESFDVYSNNFSAYTGQEDMRIASQSAEAVLKNIELKTEGLMAFPNPSTGFSSGLFPTKQQKPPYSCFLSTVIW